MQTLKQTLNNAVAQVLTALDNLPGITIVTVQREDIDPDDFREELNDALVAGQWRTISILINGFYETLADTLLNGPRAEDEEKGTGASATLNDALQLQYSEILDKLEQVAHQMRQDPDRASEIRHSFLTNLEWKPEDIIAAIEDNLDNASDHIDISAEPDYDAGDTILPMREFLTYLQSMVAKPHNEKQMLMVLENYMDQLAWENIRIYYEEMDEHSGKMVIKPTDLGDDMTDTIKPKLKEDYQPKLTEQEVSDICEALSYREQSIKGTGNTAWVERLQALYTKINHS